jgi:hypothetical protein
MDIADASPAAARAAAAKGWFGRDASHDAVAADARSSMYARGGLKLGGISITTVSYR